MLGCPISLEKLPERRTCRFPCQSRAKCPVQKYRPAFLFGDAVDPVSFVNQAPGINGKPALIDHHRVSALRFAASLCLENQLQRRTHAALLTQNAANLRLRIFLQFRQAVRGHLLTHKVCDPGLDAIAKGVWFKGAVHKHPRHLLHGA